MSQLQQTLERLQERSQYWFEKSQKDSQNREVAIDAWARHSELENAILMIRGSINEE